jgi:hypothetical protein
MTQDLLPDACCLGGAGGWGLLGAGGASGSWQGPLASGPEAALLALPAAACPPAPSHIKQQQQQLSNRTAGRQRDHRPLQTTGHPHITQGGGGGGGGGGGEEVAVGCGLWDVDYTKQQEGLATCWLLSLAPL